MTSCCKVIGIFLLFANGAVAQTTQEQAPSTPSQAPQQSTPVTAWSESWSPKAAQAGSLSSVTPSRKSSTQSGASSLNPSFPARGLTDNLNPLATTITVGPVNLGPGDLLEVGVFDAPELATHVRVNSNGEITFPLLGKLHVGGLSPQQLQDLIRERLITGDLLKDPQVGVFVSEYANQAVYVLGEVAKPGAYPLTGSHQLFDFISAAGGFTLLAGKSIIITRHANPLAPDIVRFSHDPNFGAGNPQIDAGDTVYVSKAGLVYVVGDVNKPGGYLMDPDEHMTVMEAISAAQGTKATAALASVRLIRKTEQGRVETALNIKQIFQLKGQDPTLQDQDIVYVPRNAAKVAVESLLTVGVAAAVGATIYHF